MKILIGNQAKEIDQFTIKNEPVSSIDLMERAGIRLTKKIEEIFPTNNSFTIFAGPGNNGGDGLVIARLLHEKGNRVHVYILNVKEYTQDLEENIKRAQVKKIPITYLETERNIEALNIPDSDIMVDALFGSGLNRALDGLASYLITKLNSTSNFKISIDVPSGLYIDNSAEVSWSNDTNTFKANLTLAIQFPRLGFMFAENEIYTGSWDLIDIGLIDTTINNHHHFFLGPEDIKAMIQPRPSHGHKGSFGHVLMSAGSKGKIGAAILSATAAARTGCGLLTVHVPSSAAMEIHTKFPEAMVMADENENILSTPVKNITNYTAIGFGPGVDKHPETANVLKHLIQNASQPVVIDADGLNILAENKTWLSFLNGSTILTPHPGEFDRLTQKHNTGYGRYKTQCEFSKKYGAYIVLKGHYTCITTPGGLSFFNSTGNNGMATGGSGDVLTGIITSLCAQGYSPLHACLIGVYLHGYAGDKAAEKLSKTSLIASDIIDHIPDFFLHFEK